MSMRTNAGFPDSLLTRIKNALSALTGRVTTNEGNIASLQSSLDTTNGNVDKKTVYGDFETSTQTYTASVYGGGNIGWCNKTLTKSGFYPLGIVGCTVANTVPGGSNYRGALMGYGATARSNGSISYRVYVTGGSNEAATFGITGDVTVLWVKIK